MFLPLFASLPPPTPPAELTAVSGASQADLLGTTVVPDLSNTTPISPEPTPDFTAPLRLGQANAATSVVRDQPLEVTADRQEFDLMRRLFNAIGNVLLRFKEAELTADRIQTDIDAQILVAEGNVTITRGDQVLQGDRLEYNLRLDQGSLTNARGVVNTATVDQDLNLTRSPDPPAPGPLPGFSAQNPTLQAEATETFDRLRFEADRLEFDGRRWFATNLRITNDPFSPPELEARAQQAIAEPLTADETLLQVQRGRVVFDQRLALPIVLRQFVVGRPYEILPFEFGYDERDRGGLFLVYRYRAINTPNTQVTFLPSIYLERIISNDFNFFDANSYGGAIELGHRFTPQTRLRGYGFLNTLDPSDWPRTSRAGIDLFHNFDARNLLTVSAIYRQRVFNRSLGEQEISSSFGGTFSGTRLPFSSQNLTFSYLLGGQYVTAASDDPSLPPQPSLGRLQAAASLNWAMPIWRGTPLPPTQTQGLRYSPRPVQPFLQFYSQLGGVANYYTNGSTQPALVAGAGFRGQVGHFSRNWFDYTSFDVGFTQTLSQPSSPFLFDRVTDFSVLNLGLLQQIYGPLRAGAQMQINVDTGTVFDTDIIVEYSRRTYGVVFRYNLDRQLATILLRINGFNWRGNADPFSSPGLGTATDGVIRSN
ncbi:DUF3769 domain-containing protein [Thermosynechococcus sp.]|uniref:DUF3769 domain-containing protein n=1 Tax=Thermosynechococcus sp. TaxID=2814275 RepID=UPI002606CCC5|nr:DUF3769 domain-containing protein [Thermosynechococcus sp.]